MNSEIVFQFNSKIIEVKQKISKIFALILIKQLIILRMLLRVDRKLLICGNGEVQLIVSILLQNLSQNF